MKKDRFSILLIAMTSLLMLVNIVSAQEIDTRIWSMVYWQKLADQGLVEVTTQTTVPDAVHTGSAINARTVLIDDSPDVPVTTNPNTTQSENSIFINPLDNNKALNSNNSTDNPVNTVFGTSGFMTSDFGLTWSGSIQGTGGPNSGDPAACINLNGRYYVGYIADDGGNGCAYSTDEGQTWTHVQVAPNPGQLADKNHLWVDNGPTNLHQGNLYATWTNFSFGANDGEIELSRSTDDGLTWSSSQVVSSAVNAGSHNQGVNVATGPNGEVYVAWSIYDGFPADETAIGFTKSLDGGITFQPATRIITNIRGIRTTETSKNHRVNAFPVMDVDISGGPRDGRIYIVWTNYGTPGINNGPDIDNYIIHSDDGGATWSSPVKVNQDQSGQGNEHYFPWLTCDPVTGNLSVVMYDDRNVSSTMCEVFVANSTDGGATWEDFKVSDVAFTPSPIPGLASGYFGDYIGISARGGKVYPVWTDNRSGTALTYVSPFALADPTDPNPPAEVKAYSDYTTPTDMSLSWIDPTSLANGDTLLQSDFNIQIFRDSVLIDSVLGGVEQYTDTGLNDGQLYTYTLFTKKITNDSLSLEVKASWTAGGARKPEKPTNFHIKQPDSLSLMMLWTNPAVNIDGTPMDDFDGINLYEDGNLAATFSRTGADTGKLDSSLYIPPAGTHQYHVTAFDNETPSNESDASNIAFSPISIPFFDDFPTAGVPNPGFWINTNAEITANGVNPPSTPNVLQLDGNPNGGDEVELLPVDMTGKSGQGVILSYFYQPEGNGNDPETGDSLIVEFKNDLGDWRIVRDYPGTSVHPFINEVIAVDGEDPGPGATFFHPGFQIKFRSIGTSSSTSHFDLWLIDNVFLGTPNANPEMVVTPAAINDTLLVGDSSQTIITVSNSEPIPSTLTYSVTENPPVDWVGVTPTSGTIPSNQFEELDVLIDASAVSSSGVYTTDIIISGNDTTNVEDTVTVTLVANDAPSIRVEPDSVAFTVPPGQKDSTTFTIFNDGLGPLQILSMEDEEINTRGDVAPAYQQNQAPTGTHAKGEEPVSNGGTMTDGEGGPDPFGYRWIDSDEPDGPPYVFTDISGTGTVVNLLPTGGFDAKDEGQATINLPWDVKFYGDNYNQLQVNSNGFITFDMNFFDNAFTNDGIPSTNDPNLIACPFWDDLDGTAGGDIYYEQVGNKFIIQWHNWGHYPSGTQNMIFQIVLFQNSSRIWFVYENIDDQASSTFGIENVDGTIGLSIAFNQVYAHNQLLTKISKGAEWMDQEPKTATIAAGDSLDISLKVDATALGEGTYKGRVVIATNDPQNETVNSPTVTLNVTQQTDPAISVSADSIDFDTTFVGFDSTISVFVSNIGNDTLHIHEMLLPVSAFTVDTSSFSLAPASSQEVKVTFAPPSQGVYSGFMQILSNDPVNDTISIWLQGVGESPVGILDPLGLPTTFDVAPNYPNPFNPTTTIKYQLPQRSDVQLVVYNILGQKIRTLVNRQVDAGYHTIVWDGKNDSGIQAASGIYVYRFQAEDFLKVQKMILMK